MRFTQLALLGTALSLPLAACGSSTMDDGGAANAGVFAELEQTPEVTIDDQIGTEVRVFVNMDHMGGPDAETFEVVSSSLHLDGEHYADLALAIPVEHTQWSGLANGESFDFELRGHLDDNHDDWGLCANELDAAQDGLRLSLYLLLRVTPGANDDADEFEFEARAVELHCSFTN